MNIRNVGPPGDFGCDNCHSSVEFRLRPCYLPADSVGQARMRLAAAQGVAEAR